MCSRRDAMQLLLDAPRNGPRVSSSAKLGPSAVRFPQGSGDDLW